MYTDAIEY
ncbi:Protein of unknown function [Bacillus mycoides]|nr:Protein of unknown function [Bacillus mycoides]